MKIKEIKTYKFDELSEEVQEKLYNKWLNNYEYCWHDDNINSIKAFLDLFELKIESYKFGGYRENYATYTKTIDDNILELRGSELKDWIVDNVLSSLKKDRNNEYNEYDVCLTGYCLDYNLFDPLLEYIKKENNNKSNYDLYDVVDDCLFNACDVIEKDIEYSCSFESFKEQEQDNDLDYTDDGIIID